MRTEKEMFDLIIDVAKNDDKIKGVLLSGSRASPKVPKDIYQDYDISYFVSDIMPYYNNLTWIEDKFGKPSIIQLPENMSHPSLPPIGDGHFTYLIIFEDGNRIDLSIEYKPYVDDGEPCVVLLDKDGYFPPINPKEDFWNIKPPNQKIYSDCCNEFFWCLNNVAKGIARDELPYAMRMFNVYVRDMLDQMVEWYIGYDNDFSVSAGKMGKYYKKYLPEELYLMYEGTYSNSDYKNFWNSIFTACELFTKMAHKIASSYGYAYNSVEDENMIKYLLKMKNGLLD